MAVGMLEKDLQRGVIETAHILGWRVAHFRPALNRRGKWATPVTADGAGWPDLFMTRSTRAVAAELKADGNKPTAAQTAWLAALEQAGVETVVWDCQDWIDGKVEELLR